MALALAALLGALAMWTVRPAAADPGGQVAGMVVSSTGQTASAADTMARLKADGINTVSLFVWWWTDSPQSTSLSPYSGTETDAALGSEISAARGAGLKVILVPIFYCGTCEGGWRGVMQPSDVGAFFSSYKVFIDHYAQLAQADGVWLLFAGSEMTTLEGYTGNWQDMISSVRQYFSGLVGYEQNWDVLAHPQFLDNVDVVGVSAYFPLDDGTSPSVPQLVADWSNSHAAAYSGRNWVGDLTHLANTTGKPILFGEVGYMDSDYAGRQPFLNAQYSLNPQLQANLYQALLQTFSAYSWWMGVSWWEWSDNPTDAGRTPMGKPAEQLLQNWYANGWRPAAGGGSASGTSGGAAPTAAGATGSAGSGVASPGTTVGTTAAGTGAAGTGTRAPGTTAAAGGALTVGGTLGGPEPSVPAEVAPAVPTVPSPSTTAASQPGAGVRPGPAASLSGPQGPGPVMAAAPGRPGAGFYSLAALAALALAAATAQLLADLVRRPELAAARARRRAAVARRAALAPAGADGLSRGPRR